MSESSLESKLKLGFALLKKVRPFSYNECLHLIGKTKESALSLQGKDVTICFGTSGSGKTTTLLYLTGTKMKRVRLDGIPHIKPDEIKREELKELRVSPFAKSETRYVKAITINLKDLGHFKDENFIVVDSAGIPDTESFEVDFSNSVGIIEAIKKARSVRPVLVFSYKNFGGRSESLKP
jgi:signal recognition particle GTPase